jgi:hypothetical protein
VSKAAVVAALAAALVVLGPARAARAAELQPPTVFDGAYQGLLVGALAGGATGYMFSRSDTWKETGGWKPLLYGAGIGALSGAVIGLTLGVVDLAQRHPGRNGYVMRDGLYGAGLGIVLGGIAGGLAAMSAKKGEYVLFGAAIGTLSGTVGGMAVGFVEGYRKYSVSVAPVERPDGTVGFVPALAGRF